MWNANESSAQAGNNGGVRVLLYEGARQFHIQVPDEREHLF